MKETPINAVAFDFDGTISQTHFNEVTGGYDMGELVEGMKDRINSIARDNEIIIFTARPKTQWHSVTRYLAEHGVIFDRLAEKPLAKFYVDDRALRPDEFLRREETPQQKLDRLSRELTEVKQVVNAELREKRRKEQYDFGEPRDMGEYDSDGNKL